MGDLVLAQLKDVLDAYAQQDTIKAIDVWRRDGAIDSDKVAEVAFGGGVKEGSEKLLLVACDA